MTHVQRELAKEYFETLTISLCTAPMAIALDQNNPRRRIYRTTIIDGKLPIRRLYCVIEATFTQYIIHPYTPIVEQEVL